MKKEELYIGLMSGTSMDGIDAALCRVAKEECTLLASKTFPMPSELKASVMAMIEGKTSLKAVGTLDHKLAEQFAAAVVSLLEDAQIDPADVRAVGSHGQTVWHQPGGEAPFSLQLGDPNVIAARTGIAVAADFRRMDMAFGGQGAPFAPAYHRFLFGKLEGTSVVANIGGIANISVLQKPLLGFDTGPGNVLMDLWAQRHLGKAFDENGEWARGAEADARLLAFFMEDSYFAKPAPKSTGREYFNSAWLDTKLARLLEYAPRTVQATLLELTARTVADAAAAYAPRRLIVCGGGARNDALMQRLQAMAGCDVLPAESCGANSDMVEAMAFAWLAYKRVHHETVQLKDVTGASADCIPGGLYG